MERYIGLIADNPAVVPWRTGWNVEQHACAKFVDCTVLHRRSGTAGEHHADMLYVATQRAYAGAHVNRPFPPRFIGGSADGHGPHPNQFEFAFFEGSYFVGLFKALEYRFKHQRDSL